MNIMWYTIHCVISFLTFGMAILVDIYTSVPTQLSFLIAGMIIGTLASKLPIFTDT